jgi:hypothetical protein
MLKTHHVELGEETGKEGKKVDEQFKSRTMLKSATR